MTSSGIAGSRSQLQLPTPRFQSNVRCRKCVLFRQHVDRAEKLFQPWLEGQEKVSK